MNMEDKELVKMVNPTLKRRETILFFLTVVINGLKCIVSDIGLDTCARGRWRLKCSCQKINVTSHVAYIKKFKIKTLLSFLFHFPTIFGTPNSQIKQ